MKLLNIYICTFIAILTLGTSCTPEVEHPEYEGQSFVVFRETATRTSEGFDNSKVVPIEVVRGGTSNYNNQITVSYTVSAIYENDGSDASNQIDDVSGGSITIEAGEASNNIEIRSLGDSDEDGNVIITLTINSVSDNSLSVGYPGPDGLASSTTLTLLDDDCPFNPAEYEGAWSAEDPANNWRPDSTHEVRFVHQEDVTFQVSNFHGMLEQFTDEDEKDWGRPITVRFDTLRQEWFIPTQSFSRNFTNGGAYRVRTLSRGLFSTCDTRSLSIEYEVFNDNGVLTQGEVTYFR